MRDRVASPAANPPGGFTVPSRVQVGAADHAREAEADRMADAALRGAPVARPSRDAPVLRRESPEKSDTDKLKDGGEKVLEASAETELGKRILQGVKDLSAVKWAIGTKAGLVVTGGAAVGTVLGLGLSGSKLPMQVPAIPFGNWTFQLKWKGPLFDPTDAMLTITYKFGGASDDAKARATPAKPAPHPLMSGVAEGAAGRPPAPEPWLPPLPLSPGMPGYVVKVPEQKPAPPPSGLQLRKPDLAEAIPQRRPVFHLDTPQLKLDDAPLLSRSATGESPAVAPLETQRVLGSPGRALEPATRSDMERRFGLDLGAIRIHDDAEGQAGARAVSARAWACGEHLAFDEGMYRPGTPDGRRLLAHEIAHVVQQGAA